MGLSKKGNKMNEEIVKITERTLETVSIEFNMETGEEVPERKVKKLWREFFGTSQMLSHCGRIHRGAGYLANKHSFSQKRKNWPSHTLFMPSVIYWI
jgi:hypothetical protein